MSDYFKVNPVYGTYHPNNYYFRNPEWIKKFKKKLKKKMDENPDFKEVLKKVVDELKQE